MEIFLLHRNFHKYFKPLLVLLERNPNTGAIRTNYQENYPQKNKSIKIYQTLNVPCSAIKSMITQWAISHLPPPRKHFAYTFTEGNILKVSLQT